ncbi:UNVERIFIED_CONTAM: putative [ribosomal protein S5]-alanine N-acetyltransferase [Sesamum radiatum]|uniref:[ribosomal protein S5]-alanine N-acetyltransferase n=1 Tax=Sesamum radiatum TaxID=300843 RepID=A0AAW2S8X4_SESRA
MDESSAKSGEDKVQESFNITLRHIALSDVDDFMVWATDDRVTKFCLWDTYTSKEQAVEYIKNQAIPHPWLRAVCLGNHVIGTITVDPCSGSGSCRAELGYVLAHKHWGKGIATRAVKMVVSTIFKDWPHLQRLQAVVHVENKGSQRVLEKAGFQREGVLRSYELFKGKPVDVVMFSTLGNDSSFG